MKVTRPRTGQVTAIMSKTLDKHRTKEGANRPTIAAIRSMLVNANYTLQVAPEARWNAW